MQDDTTKRTTVEDQELADMIANLNSATPNSSNPTSAPSAPVPSPAQNTAPSAAPSSLPPLPPSQPSSMSPAPTPNPVNSTSTQTPPDSSNFNIPSPSPGLTPLPTAGTPIPDTPTANKPVADDTEKFEPPVSTLPPLGHKTPLPPLPGEDKDPDSDIDEIAADFPDPSKSGKPSRVPVKQNDEDLNTIKQDALDKLRPLVDELDLSAQEKFDTLLLLIRSNDDKSLIPQAYETADKIENGTARAAALLDIVKEIDFFENR